MKDYLASAAALYGGGWRAEDRDQLIEDDSISGVLGINAEEMLDSARDAVKIAASLGWQEEAAV